MFWFKVPTVDKDRLGILSKDESNQAEAGHTTLELHYSTVSAAHFG